MAEKDPGSEPSLELPSFGFGRKKRKPAPEVPASQDTPAAEPETAPEATPTGGEPTPVPTPQTEADAPPSQRVAEDTPMGGEAATEPPPATVADAPPSAPAAPANPPTSGEPTPVPTPQTEADAPPTQQAAKPPKAPREFTLPSLPPLHATLVTGAVVGLLAVALNFAALQGCDLIRGTTSCGGPGVLLLVAILILITYVGGWLLRGFHVDDAGSTAFLAVGLLTVVVMLFFVDALFEWWMVIAIPVLSIAAFVASWKLTTSFADVDVE